MRNKQSYPKEKVSYTYRSISLEHKSIFNHFFNFMYEINIFERKTS